MSRFSLCCIVVIVLLQAYPAYSFQTTDDNKTLEFSRSIEDTIRSKFGDCPKFRRSACGNMLRLICDRDRQDRMSVKRTEYFVDADLNPVAPNCNGWDPKNCHEPIAWVTCEKVKHYRGIEPSPLTLFSVKAKFGMGCTVTDTCEDMLHVDCGAAADGPAYLLDLKLNILAPDGGLCMAGCSGHESEWTKWSDCQRRSNETLLKTLEAGGDVPPLSIMSKY